MELIKTIYQNKKQINIFKMEGEEAKTEFINLLADKIRNRYKIQISFDHIYREAKANLYFDHETAEGQKIKYCYNYYFYNIESKINLL